ncbi:MAG: histidine kinase [Lachnospiraceae bacterium]|nr:histidine kinase [Lachnospiraceae bacterium]
MQLKKSYRIAVSAFLFISVIMLIIFSFSQYNISAKSITDGYLDLTDADLDNSVYSLDGMWNFTPNSFVDPNISGLPYVSTIKVPGYIHQFQSLESESIKYGTYELNISLPAPGTYCLKTSLISGAYRLYCNGSFIAEVGKVGYSGESEKSVWQPTIYLLDTDTRNLTITFQISNFNLQQGGLVNNLYFGTADNIYFFQSMQTIKSAVIIGIFVGIGIYLLLLTCMNRHRRTGLCLSIFCLGSALLETLLDENIFFYFFRNLPSIIPLKLQYIAYAILITCIFYFFKYFTPPQKNNIIMTIVGILNITYLVLMIFVTSYSIATFAGELSIVLLLINISIILYNIIRVIRSKKKYAYISLISIVILFILSFLQFYYIDTVTSLQFFPRENLFIVGILFFLLCQFNILLEDVDEAYENANQATSMEIAYLQAQISPHFMFNTLNNVSYLMDNDVPKAQDLLLRFCDYLRTKYKFDFRNRTEYTLEEELDFLSNYIYIENIRFRDMITLIINVPDSLKSIYIMPLILQPLVENAIKHGFSSKPLTIELSVDEYPDHYLFTVKDNGKGMNSVQLHNVTQNTGTGVGIKNINYRLGKLCGETLHFESTPGVGTTISFNYAKEK